ncbi:MAG: DUF4169 family protein [Paracoccaceae bacterium]
MSKITNLRQFRKTSDRMKKREQASENASLHGRSKAQKVLEASQSARARKMLDAHRLEDDEEAQGSP